MATVFWKVNGVAMPCPSTFVFGLQDISLSESGRTDDAIMHKNRVAQKRKLQVGYNGVKDTVATTVLQAVNPEYIDVTYYDLLDGQIETRCFYVGDRTSNFKWWWNGNHTLESLAFDLIER